MQKGIGGLTIPLTREKENIMQLCALGVKKEAFSRVVERRVLDATRGKRMVRCPIELRNGHALWGSIDGSVTLMRLQVYEGWFWWPIPDGMFSRLAMTWARQTNVNHPCLV